MNEEIEYAEMLEIPVSTVNVIRKNRRRKKAAETLAAPKSTVDVPLKDSVIAQVNDRLNDAPEQTSALPDPLAQEIFASAEQPEPDPIPDRIDTVRLYANDSERAFHSARLSPQDYPLEDDTQNEGGRYAYTENRTARIIRVALGAEFALACALCGAIFLTNVFMPNSAINTFFRSLSSGGAEAAAVDARTYSDFTLSPVVSELTDAELTLSPTGILSFTEECCVYPAANGKVSEVTETNGIYTLKISYSDTFTGVINGLDYVYYAVGEEVKANVPVGFSKGETEVQVTMYSEGELLNCFELTEENCLAWVEQE